MAVVPILQLGNPVLYRACAPIESHEVGSFAVVVTNLHDTLLDFRERNGFGRAIAAPQIGVERRLVFAILDRPMALFNPSLDNLSDDMIELWDDCMSFPDLLVKVRRHRRCRLTYRDADWKEHHMLLEDDRSELLQHECDHLDGMLALARAIDERSFAYRSEAPDA